MPYITMDEVRSMGELRPGMGFNLKSIFGGSKSTGTPDEFNRWSSILDQYTDLIPYINNSQVREKLAHEANQLYPVQQKLKAEFAGDAGTSTTTQSVQFANDVASFRSDVSKAKDTYGTLANPQDVYLLKNFTGGKKSATAGKAKAGFSMPIWGWGLLALLAWKKLK